MKKFKGAFSGHVEGLALLLVLLLPLARNLSAQPETYNGFRLGLFHFEARIRDARSVELHFDLANTGRLPVSFGKKNETPPRNLLVEFDTAMLPVYLQGRENKIVEALLREKIALNPGAVLDGLMLEIAFEPGEIPILAQTPGATACPDLVFDTAYVFEQTDKTVRISFVLRNAGSGAVRLLGATTERNDNLAVQSYFVSGAKLTRGAIPAAMMQIRKGVETLDGWLLPGGLLQGTLEVPLKNRTKFSPNLALEIDPFQTADDCNRSNNVRSLPLLPED